MLPNYQARSPFVLKHTTSMYVYMDGMLLKHTTSMYVRMYGWYVCPLKVHGGPFPPKNTAF